MIWSYLRTLKEDTLFMDRCRRIESMIKHLSLIQMEELFKIFQKNECPYTVNNNGVFLNLSWLSLDILNEVEQFIKFCLESKRQLDQYEAIYQHLNKTFHEPMEDDTDTNKVILEEPIETVPDIKKNLPRISSSMKFYLFKKKFSKNMLPVAIIPNKDRLEKEMPVCKN